MFAVNVQISANQLTGKTVSEMLCTVSNAMLNCTDLTLISKVTLWELNFDMINDVMADVLCGRTERPVVQYRRRRLRLSSILHCLYYVSSYSSSQ